ncbi:hypothetical protein NQ315_005400 [Exocentrus adspersus]|uniref:protein acetyllysine N-acetyltransferase n=1 Tax=Exocentrus adspersus TaxID=1586481 RepID=A0AAV8W3N4_9CUCU|nr:hypothetical protein NQ315_005400 [Exocentrus adspersus]
MSCNYADGLSPYSNKGVLGLPETFEQGEQLDVKCSMLAEWIINSKHVVVHTGAGISTAAEDQMVYGHWKKKVKKPNINISFNDAIPTKTHMALKHLIDKKYIHYIISQNIDGLHLRTGISRSCIAELHGNMFTEQCNICESQFVRYSPAPTVGKKCLEEDCKRYKARRRGCRGKLYDTILDWEDSLPEYDLEISDYHSSVADLNICLGTTLQIVPSGNLPLKNKKFGGKLVIVNLQPTKQDKKADLIINFFVDDVMSKVMKSLSLEIPEYTPDIDPTKINVSDAVIEWNIDKNDIRSIKTQYDKILKEYRKRKLEEKSEKETVNKVLKYEYLAKKENKPSNVVIDLTID